MDNLVSGNAVKDFYVWVNLESFLIKHNLGLIGSFISTPSQSENLMFLPNPNFTGMVSPFHSNVTRNYMVEYSLELGRRVNYPTYPSRLEAVFLLESHEEAQKYYRNQLQHVGGRILKKAHTVGEYSYSSHDSAWIDFWRLPHTIDQETSLFICQAYWTGQRVCDHPLSSMGKPWTAEPVIEVLYHGRINFYNKALMENDKA